MATPLATKDLRLAGLRLSFTSVRMFDLQLASQTSLGPVIEGVNSPWSEGIVGSPTANPGKQNLEYSYFGVAGVFRLQQHTPYLSSRTSIYQGLMSLAVLGLPGIKASSY